MILPDAYKFLSELKENNNKAWFDENRKRYEQIRQSVVLTAELLIHEISDFDKSVSGIQPKNCIFRINRDIRFSNDKSPYKTNMGIFVTPGGKNASMAGYYMHIEPGNSFLSGGIYIPPSPVLKAIRQEIYSNYDEFLGIINDSEFKDEFTDFWGEKLKTKPKGFPDDFEGLEYLRLKHYAVIKPENDELMTSEKLIGEIRKVYAALYPLNRFINQAIKEI